MSISDGTSDTLAGRGKRPGLLIEFGPKLALAACSILLALVVGEVGARIVARVDGVDFTLYMRELTNSNRLPKGLLIDHPTRRWTLNPNQRVLATTSDFSVGYGVNAQGFRDLYYPYQKPRDKIRAVALGDSLTFGEGIPYGERYTDIAEAALRNLEVLTMAVPGYGFDQMMLTFAEEGVKYHPDLVFLCLATTVLSRHSLGAGWIEGAPIESIATGSWADGGSSATIYRRESDPLLGGDTNIVLRNSYLISFFYYKLTLRMLKQRMAQEDLTLWGPRTFDDRIPEPLAATVDKQATYLASGLRRLAALAKEMKFRIVILNIDPGLVLRVQPSDLPPGALIIDFSADLRSEAARRNLRFKYDPHYNPETNRFMGKLLAAALKAGVPGVTSGTH